MIVGGFEGLNKCVWVATIRTKVWCEILYSELSTRPLSFVILMVHPGKQQVPCASLKCNVRHFRSEGGARAEELVG